MKSSSSKRYLEVTILLVLVFLFCYRIFADFGKFGMADWDQHLFYYGSFIKSIAEYQQAPFWNPWFCGGNVLWQHPQIPLVSPAYLFSLVMPLLAAMKINIVLHYAIAILGMYLVARQLGVRRFSLILPGASIFVFNSFIAMQLAEGHTWIFPFAYVPFAWYFFDRALCSDRRLDIVLAAIVLSLMLLGAGIYPLVYALMLLVIQSAVTAWVGRQCRPVLKLGIVLFFLAGFSSVKLLPVLDFVSQYPRVSPHNEYVTWSGLYEVFFGRTQMAGAERVIPGQIWGWHEYGCYVGLALGLLVLVSWAFCFIRRSRVALVAGIGLTVFFLIAMGRFHDLAPYAWYSHLPVLESLKVPGRAFIVGTFCASLAYFVLAQWIESKIGDPRSRYFGMGSALVALLIVADLFYVNSPVFGQAFRFDPQPVYDRIPPSDEPIRTVRRLPGYGSGSSMYVGLTRNIATLACYEPQIPELGFRPSKGLVHARGEAEIDNIRFTPNHVSFDLDARGPVLVSLNQNHVRGWRFSEGPVRVVAESPAAELAAGKYQDLRFYFVPPGLPAGAMLTLVSILLAIFFVRPGLVTRV